MTFATVTKILKVCTAAVILNYSVKRDKRKLIYFSERKNNQALKAVHPLQGGSNATEDMVQGYKTSNSTDVGLKERRMRNPVL